MKDNYYKQLFIKNYVSREEYEERVENSKEFLDLVLRHRRDLLEPFWDFVIRIFTASTETPGGKTIPSLFDTTVEETAEVGLKKILFIDTIKHDIQNSILMELYRDMVNKLQRDEDFFQEFTDIFIKMRFKVEEFVWKPLDKETIAELYEQLFPLFMPIVNPERKDFELLPEFVKKMNEYLNKYDLELTEDKGVWVVDFDKFLEVKEPLVVKLQN